MLDAPTILTIQKQFRRIFTSDDATDDEGLDAALGLNRLAIETGMRLGALLVAHGQHRLEAADLHYDVIRDIYRNLDLKSLAKTTLVDLGCGYGRIGFWGAVLFGQSYHGIEKVPERVAEARRVSRELGLENLQFEVGDILTCVWPDATNYLMLNSVFPCYIPPIIERFRQIAVQRNITIVSASSSNEQFRRECWLRELIPACKSAGPPVSLRLFTS